METVFAKDAATGHSNSWVSWGAIFAGAILAAGLWVLFHVLGLAAGLTAIDPHSPSSLRAAGIGTGIWSIIASLLALFAGGIVAAQVADSPDRISGALHGAVLWALTTLAGVALIVSLAGMVASGAARVSGVAARATGGLGSLAMSADPMQLLGLETSDLILPLNQKLREQGKPSILPTQLQQAIKDAAQTGFDAHLVKPVSLERLQDLLRTGQASAPAAKAQPSAKSPQ